MGKAEAGKARYEYLKARHRCTTCGGQDAFTLAGRVRCEVCAERGRAISHACYDRRRDQCNERKRERYNALRAAGLCTSCGRRQAVSGESRCTVCRDAARRRDRERRAKTRACLPREERAQRPERGLCYRCGRPVKEGTRPWVGTPIRLCPDCYEKNCANLAKGREVFRVTHGGRSWGQEFCKRYGINQG